VSTPVAVLISDVHYNINTLEVADAAMRMAVSKANDLEVPLIVAGDLHDTKANMRGECVNAMLKTLGHTLHYGLYIIIGNHDRINEKAPAHALNFLDSVAEIIDYPQKLQTQPPHPVWVLPYYHNPDELKAVLATIKPGSTIIMHQGVQGSNMGDYIQDHSALPKECFKDFRVISGHYHSRQDIQCGPTKDNEVGWFSYIGNPYTLGFGESQDPPKGFRILMSNGCLKFVPTNLRRHTILDMSLGEFRAFCSTCPLDSNNLHWVKIRDTKEQLLNASRDKVAALMRGVSNFKLDLIALDTNTKAAPEITNLAPAELLDMLIDSAMNTSDDRKLRLKTLWRNIC